MNILVTYVFSLTIINKINKFITFFYLLKFEYLSFGINSNIHKDKKKLFISKKKNLGLASSLELALTLLRLTRTSSLRLFHFSLSRRLD